MNISFGTDGIRGPFNVHNFGPQLLHTLGYALGDWLHHKTDNPRVVILHDTRQSCSYVKSALKSGLLLHPLTIIDTGILPTPAATVLLEKFNATIAIIISASHNPYHDNGIKIITSQGKLTPEDEQLICKISSRQHSNSFKQPGTELYSHQAQQLYCDYIISLFPQNMLRDKSIVLDTAHGATYKVAKTIIEGLGGNPIMLHAQPNGSNINDQCGSVYPQFLQKIMPTTDAICGFAFDGDGDRVIAVSRTGELKNGDDLLYFLATHHPTYQSETSIVGTIMSNKGLEHILLSSGKKFIRTKVGDKYVKQALDDHNAQLGGEPSGHIILKNYAPTGDGILAALMVLEAMIINKTEELSTFTHYPQLLLNCAITHQKNLDEEPFKSLIAYYQELIRPGRINLRYSGTEPLLRLMIECPLASDAEKFGKELMKKLSAHL